MGIVKNKHFFLFPSGKFGYSCKRQTKLSWSKYIAQRLLTLTKLFFAEITFLEINLCLHVFSRVPNQIFLREFLFVDGQILVILGGLIFVVGKIFI